MGVGVGVGGGVLGLGLGLGVGFDVGAGVGGVPKMNCPLCVYEDPDSCEILSESYSLEPVDRAESVDEPSHDSEGSGVVWAG